MAAARNTLETLWRPPKALLSLLGSHQIDSVYAKTTLARGKITVNKKKNSPTVIVLGGVKWLSLLMNLKISVRRKHIHLRDMIIQEERKISGGQLQNFIRGMRSSTLWSSMEINSGLSTVVGKLHRNIRSVRRQDSKPTAASATYPSSTPQPGTDITPAHRNRLCQDIATEYAYREGLCGASDPEDYVSVARERYTCKHRCGRARTLGEMLFKCSCDEICLIHED
ncbi:hypothetical protein PoB_004491300 [Plakobranchus ocellatus]|uniref:Uncharacterized protein n=1 Tax=Plakobranchus ocellatus TaxID=259542 RepID=A0AAV4BGW6_9GAST|nr:hypothetical protein PoB_004491300 [Plakobranchus ocellatus]